MHSAWVYVLVYCRCEHERELIQTFGYAVQSTRYFLFAFGGSMVAFLKAQAIDIITGHFHSSY